MAFGGSSLTRIKANSGQPRGAEAEVSENSAYSGSVSRASPELPAARSSRAVLYAITQPPEVNVEEVAVRPQKALQF